jgi:hypothetical protein
MAKKPGRFKNKPTGLAAFIGRTLGKLAAKRDRLARQLAGVDKEIADVRASVGRLPDAPKAEAARKRAPMSEATRKKMADAAKARWAKVKKAGGTRQG